MKRGLLLLILILTFFHEDAQVVIDGVKSTGEYPANNGAITNPIATQLVQTQFGDNAITDPVRGDGNELDALYINYDNDFICLFLAGNLESNFNKLELFINSKAGGQNTILAVPPNPAVDPGCGCANGALSTMEGLTFDTGFEPDFYFTFGHGSGPHNYGFFPESWVTMQVASNLLPPFCYKLYPTDPWPP